MMMAHGLVSSCLFLMVNVCYQLVHTRRLFLMKGVLTISPMLRVL